MAPGLSVSFNKLAKWSWPVYNDFAATGKGCENENNKRGKKKKKPRQNPNEFVPKAIFSAYHSSMTVIPISFYCSKPQGGADRPCHAATREGPG
jgi:hypothetical protein